MRGLAHLRPASRVEPRVHQGRALPRLTANSHLRADRSWRWMLLMKSSTIAALEEDFVTAARARGLSEAASPPATSAATPSCPSSPNWRSRSASSSAALSGRADLPVPGDRLHPLQGDAIARLPLDARDLPVITALGRGRQPGRRPALQPARPAHPAAREERLGGCPDDGRTCQCPRAPRPRATSDRIGWWQNLSAFLRRDKVGAAAFAVFGFFVLARDLRTDLHLVRKRPPT